MLALFAADQPNDRILGRSANAQLLDRPVAGFGPFHGRRPVRPPLYFRLWRCNCTKAPLPGKMQPLLGPVIPVFLTFIPGWTGRLLHSSVT